MVQIEAVDTTSIIYKAVDSCDGGGEGEEAEPPESELLLITGFWNSFPSYSELQSLSSSKL